MTVAVVLLALFAVAFGAVWLFARRHPLLGTLAGREATRRRGQSLLVVGGLMVGTATITAALVAAESVGDSTVDAFAYRNWGHVDLTVSSPDNAFFPAAVAAGLAADPALSRLTDGIAAGIEVVGSAADLTQRQGASGVTIVGFDPAAQPPFGAFQLVDGRRTFGDDLSPGAVILSRTLADKLDARPGDTLRVASETAVRNRAPRGSGLGGDPLPPVPPALRVHGIARSEGPGGYTLGSVVFAPLDTVQRLLFTDAINVVRVSAPGGIRDADPAARRALPALERATERIRGTLPLVARAAKLREAELANEGTSFIRAMLVGMSAIVVAAGAALVVNITGMLAEERRTQLGILRALGLRRRRVAGLSVVEGAMYAVAAGVAGVVAGLGLGRLVAARFGAAFAEFAGEDFDFTFFFTLEPAAVAGGFAAGSLLTLVVIFFASRRTSRMTITAAIRNLPEPPPDRRARRWPRRIRLALGTLAGGAGLAAGAPFPRLAGSIALVLVASSLARSRLSPRTHATLTGLALCGPSFGIIAGMSPETDPGEFFGVFVVALLTSVFGLTILAAANLHIAETVVGALGRAFSGWRAALRPPLAYLSRRPVRTGLTTGVFALIIAMLTLFSVFLIIFQPTYDRFGNGFDVRVLSTGSAQVTIPASVAGDVERSMLVPTRGYVGPFEAEGGFGSSERTFVPLFETPSGAPEPRGAPVALVERGKKYKTDAAVWEAVLRDPTLVVSNFAAPESTIELRGSNGTVTFTVAGSQPFGMLDGMLMSPTALAAFPEAPRGATLLADLKPGVDARQAARRIERELFFTGVDADSVAELLERSDRANRAFFSTIDILMRMGLVVGILSLGIVALRVVTERRQVIGVLRAIGYRRRRVMAGLLAEAGVTATIGVGVGATVGVIMGYIFYRQQENAPDFGIDWANFGGVLGLVYAAVLLVTLFPAWRASRLPPAEAVRYSE